MSILLLVAHVFGVNRILLCETVSDASKGSDTACERKQAMDE